MNEEKGKVYAFRKAAAGGGDNGDRLRNVRLTGIETRLDTILPHLATKEDIQKIKVWALAGVLGGIALAVTIALAFLKIFGA